MILRDNKKVDVPDTVEDTNEDFIVVEDEYEEEVVESKDSKKDASKPVVESNYESNQPFFKNKWVRYGCIFGAILVLVVIFVLIISSCSASKLKGFDMTKIPVLYVDEEFDLKIVPTEDLEKQVKYKFKMKDENIAYVKYPTLKGKNVKNTIVPTMAGETTLEIKAGRADSSSKIIVCNRLDKDLADKELGVKLNKSVDLDLGLGESQECYDNLEISVSDKSILEVEGISVTGKKAGSATVTVSDGKNEVEIKVKVSTKNIYVTSLTAKEDTVELEVGQAKQLDVTANPSDATNKEVRWSSNDSKIASVDDNGVLTAKATGSTTIKAEAKDGSGKKTTIKVSVKKATSQSTGSNAGSSTGSTGSSSSSSTSSGSSAKTTYYQYRTKTTTTVSTQMCNYYNARYVTGTYYTVGSFNIAANSVSNSVGLKLESSNVRELKVSADAGKEYVNFGTYCSQRTSGTVYWPNNPSSNPSNCNDWTFKSAYAAPASYISSISVGNPSKNGSIANGYDVSYTVYYSGSRMSNYYNGRGLLYASIGIRFTANYYALDTNISTAKCSNLNSTQSKFIVKRYNDNKSVVSYSDYKWTSNPNLANAEYTGQTKVE